MSYKYLLGSNILSESELGLFLEISYKGNAKSKLEHVKKEATEHFRGTNETMFLSNEYSGLTIVK